MESKRLENYADLIVNTGINPDPGQDVVITAGFDQLDFVRLVTEKSSGENAVSPFQALMVSTASRVGTGNIVGVANAIAIGGYGAE